MPHTLRILAPLLAVLAATPLAAHEFWISPQAYRIAPGEAILADIRVGQEFEGPASVYLPGSFVRFEIVSGDRMDPVEGRMGDRPAANVPTVADGLAILVHETTDSVLTYTDMTKFEAFAAHKDFLWAVGRHAERGLPASGFRETYRRYAKALIAVGAGAGQDRRTGLEFELVALANPYDLPAGGELAVQLWKADAPLPATQIELFAKAGDGTVTITRHRTDDAGIVRLPLAAGTEYLVDSVILEPRDPATEVQGAAWHSLWAALTFRTPG